MSRDLAKHSALKIQARVIYALFMREILTRYGRHNIGFLWLFAEPMIFTLGVTAMWTALKSVHGSNLPIVAFAITGYSCVLLWRNMPGRTISAIDPNLSLLYHKPVKVLDIFIARLFLEFVGATTSFVTLVVIFYSVGWVELPIDVLKIVLGWFLLTFFGIGLALLLGGLSITSELVEKFWHPASYLIFPLSGSAFIVDGLPARVHDLVLWIPMVNATELIREGYFGNAFQAHYDLQYLIGACLLSNVLGLAQVRRAAQAVVPE